MLQGQTIGDAGAGQAPSTGPQHNQAAVLPSSTGESRSPPLAGHAEVLMSTEVVTYCMSKELWTQAWAQCCFAVCAHHLSEGLGQAWAFAAGVKPAVVRIHTIEALRLT